jgi:hypothetical protein
MLLGAVAQAQNFAITATTEAAIRKNIVKGNAANYGFGMINDTLKLVGLTTRNVIFTSSTSKTDIGLGNVDNTSDLNKPVSTATQTALNLKQNQLNGTGFIKATGTTISYDNSTYLSTSSASSTYLPISNPTATGTLTAPTIANSLGANFATTSGNVGIGTASPATNLHVNRATTLAFPLLRLETTGTGGRPYIDFKAESSDLGYIGYASTGAGIMYMMNYSNTDLQFGTNSIVRMAIKNNGNVTLGTTTDAGYKLDVNGNIRTVNDAYLATTAANNVGIGTVNPYSKLQITRSGALGSFLRFDTGGNSGYDFNLDANASMRLTYMLSGSIYKELATFTYTGQVGIGTTTPNASSILDITSTTKGILFPRMTTTEISAISSPADGLTVYNTTLKVICFYDAGAAVWKRVSHSNM